MFEILILAATEVKSVFFQRILVTKLITMHNFVETLII